MKANGQWVPCVRNSYSFTPILFKLYRCFYHPLKICMWFGYNPQINFSHFFRNLNLVIFRAFWQWKRMDSGYLVCATPPIVSFRFFWNFTDVFTRLWRYACGLDMLLRLIFITFARNLNLVIFRSFWQWKWMDGYLVCATPPTVSFWFFWNFTVVFIMLWRYAYDLHIILSLIVSTFSQFELSHFLGIYTWKVHVASQIIIV